MHNATMRSPRLQAMYRALQAGPKSTRELIAETGYCAINSISAELKACGIPITCHYVGRSSNNNPIYMYRLERETA